MSVANIYQLWSFVRNDRGELGINTTTHRSSPVQVGTNLFDISNNWAILRTGLYFTLGVKLDGTIWSWVYNAYGQLDLDDTNSRFSLIKEEII